MAEVGAIFCCDLASIGAGNAMVPAVLTDLRFGDALIDAVLVAAAAVANEISKRDVALDEAVTVPGVDISALTVSAPPLADGTVRALLQSVPTDPTDIPTPQQEKVFTAADAISNGPVHSLRRGAPTGRTGGSRLPERAAEPAPDAGIIQQREPHARALSTVTGKAFIPVKARIEMPPRKIAEDGTIMRPPVDFHAAQDGSGKPVASKIPTSRTTAEADVPVADPRTGVAHRLPLAQDAPALGLAPQPLAPASVDFRATPDGGGKSVVSAIPKPRTFAAADAPAIGLTPQLVATASVDYHAAPSGGGKLRVSAIPTSTASVVVADAPGMALTSEPMAPVSQPAMTLPIVEPDRRSDDLSFAPTRTKSAPVMPPIPRADTMRPMPEVFPAIDAGGLTEAVSDEPIAAFFGAAVWSGRTMESLAVAGPLPGAKATITDARTAATPQEAPDASARPADTGDVRARRTDPHGRRETRGAPAPGAAHNIARATPPMRITEEGASAPNPKQARAEMEPVPLHVSSAVPTEVSPDKITAKDGLEPAARRADREGEPASGSPSDVGAPATPAPTQSAAAAEPALGHVAAADSDAHTRGVGQMRAAQDSGGTSRAPARLAPTEASPTHQLAHAMGALRIAGGGAGHVTLDLHPEALGQVQVRMIRSSGDSDRIEITVGRAETLALLRADVSALHRALDSAGFTPAGRDVVFQFAAPDAMPPGNAMDNTTGNATGNLGQSATSDGSGRGSGQAGEGWGGENRGGVMPAAGMDGEDTVAPSPAPARRRSAGLDITA